MEFKRNGDRKARQSAAYQRRIKRLVEKLNEITSLCNASACLVFYRRDGAEKFVAWPSLEKANSLIESYCALPEIERNMNTEDQESYLKAQTEKMKEKLDHSRKRSYANVDDEDMETYQGESSKSGGADVA
ncbi:unnamed protein product [Eruca vesicaria subsp. sativa]|uniref:MADS-box domain-containing protein n=1 Tax=Eruca vesicaria subsp. sativa TaxID=29727 RepID=A0ABC8LXA3_ERUVS|nr:unnamed protein product [Eruca vesicaria subsp. sativa]